MSQSPSHRTTHTRPPPRQDTVDAPQVHQSPSRDGYLGGQKSLRELLDTADRLKNQADLARLDPGEDENVFMWYARARNIINKEIVVHPLYNKELSELQKRAILNTEKKINQYLTSVMPMMMERYRTWRANNPDISPKRPSNEEMEEPSEKYSEDVIKRRSELTGNARVRADKEREMGRARERMELSDRDMEKLSAKEAQKERKEAEQSERAEARRKRDKERDQDRRSKRATRRDDMGEGDLVYEGEPPVRVSSEASRGDKKGEQSRATGQDSSSGGVEDADRQETRRSRRVEQNEDLSGITILHSTDDSDRADVPAAPLTPAQTPVAPKEPPTTPQLPPEPRMPVRALPPLVSPYAPRRLDPDVPFDPEEVRRSPGTAIEYLSVFGSDDGTATVLSPPNDPRDVLPDRFGIPPDRFRATFPDESPGPPVTPVRKTEVPSKPTSAVRTTFPTFKRPGASKPDAVDTPSPTYPSRHRRSPSPELLDINHGIRVTPMDARDARLPESGASTSSAHWVSDSVRRRESEDPFVYGSKTRESEDAFFYVGSNVPTSAPPFKTTYGRAGANDPWLDRLDNDRDLADEPRRSLPNIYEYSNAHTPSRAESSSRRDGPPTRGGSSARIPQRATSVPVETSPSPNRSGERTPRERSPPRRGQSMPVTLSAEDEEDGGPSIRVAPVEVVWKQVPAIRSPPFARVKGGIPGSFVSPARQKPLGEKTMRDMPPATIGAASELLGAGSKSGVESVSSKARAPPQTTANRPPGTKGGKFAYPHEASPYKGATERSKPFKSNSTSRSIEAPPREAVLFQPTPGDPHRAGEPSSSRAKPWQRPAEIRIPRREPTFGVPPPGPSYASYKEPHRASTQPPPHAYAQPPPMQPSRSFTSPDPPEHSQSRAAYGHQPSYSYSRHLRRIRLPRPYMPKFLNAAKINTAAGIDTCGILLGRRDEEGYLVTHLRIPHQMSGTAGGAIVDLRKVKEYADEEGLIVLGRIHYHANNNTDTFTAVDLHALAELQWAVPEAFAISVITRDEDQGLSGYAQRHLSTTALYEIHECRHNIANPHSHGPSIDLFDNPMSIQLEHVQHIDGTIQYEVEDQIRR